LTDEQFLSLYEVVIIAEEDTYILAYIHQDYLQEMARYGYEFEVIER